MRRRQFLPAAVGVVALGSMSRAAFGWPDQPIRLVGPFTPGTGPDIIARFTAERLSARLGQPVVVENVAGASGNSAASRPRGPSPTATR